MLAPWSTREVKRDEGMQEAIMCNGAIATRGVTTLEFGCTVPSDPFAHLQQREMLQLLQGID